MTRASSNDLDYLTTRLHARRSRMAEGERLDTLCNLRTLPELGRALFPGAELPVAADFQRQLVENLAREISGLLKHLEAEDQELMAWLLARFQWENVKILLRGFLNRLPLETVQPHLVSLPPSLALEATALLAAKTLEEFVNRLPAGCPRKQLQRMVAGQHERPPAFLLEAALDGGYFRELIARNNRLSGGEEEIVKPMIFQETNLFQFLLVARGKFHFGLTAERLLPLRLGRDGAGGDWFNTWLSAPDIPTLAKSGVGVIIDALPAARSAAGEPTAIDIPAIEALGWQRYLRLANSAFRRSHNGVGAVVGYFGVRRVEIANLISLSECIRLRVEEPETRMRMIPRTELEAAHV